MLKRFLVFAACLSALYVSANDLDIFCATGPVQSIKVVSVSPDFGEQEDAFYEFDSNGNLVKVNGYNVRIERDGEGRIWRIWVPTIDEDEEVIEENFTIGHDETGKVKSVKGETLYDTYDQVFFYNENNLPKYSCIQNGVEGSEFVYEYLKADDDNNWTERTIFNSCGLYFDGNEWQKMPTDPNLVPPTLQKRVIKYSR